MVAYDSSTAKRGEQYIEDRRRGRGRVVAEKILSAIPHTDYRKPRKTAARGSVQKRGNGKGLSALARRDVKLP